LFREHDFPGAIAAYELAAAKAGEPGLAAKSKYNQGNASLKQAEAWTDRDQPQALSSLLQGAEHYQQALALVPDFAEAARNLELIRQRLARLQEQLKVEQDPARSKSSGDSANKLEELGADQPALAEETRSFRPGEKSTEDPIEKPAERQEELHRRPEELAAQAADAEEKKGPGALQGRQEENPDASDDREKDLAALTAADILNREKSLQRLRQKMRATASPKVDKDW
jgi:hypothetical protein